MKEEIINNIGNPRQLENLYRDNKTTFRRAFNLLYPTIKENTTAQIWNERLNFESNDISWGTGSDLTFVLIASLLAGAIAKIPDFAVIKPDYFYPRNIAFIIFPLLTSYFAWKRKADTKRLISISLVFQVSAIYINTLPDNEKSDTLLLACIHLPLLLWSVLGFAYVGNQLNKYQNRLDFLQYNGDLVVMTTIILLAGGLMTGITLGLFSLINLQIENFYFQYIAIWGLAASPIVGTYLIQTNPQLVNKVSPIIAKVFTPLVLVTLVIYLIAVIYTGKDPYNDREFLLVFNLLLIGVMAIILFSTIETSRNSGSRIETVLLLGLAAVTVTINSIALSAVAFRIFEWGITPNRLAVLGGNILILANLLTVTYQLVRTVRNHNEIQKVENSIAAFLPIYGLWATLVTFVIPLLFNFK